MLRSHGLGARFAAALAIAVTLIACGDNETTERKAFIEFLQTRIVNKPGIHVPQLTADETAALGRYAAHYAVIADFNAHLDQTVAQPMRHALESGAPRSLGDLASRRRDIGVIAEGITAIHAALDRELAAAEAARAKLQQPDDLKPVYAAAYERDVTRPAAVWAEIFPDFDAAMRSILALADFLDQHKDAIAIDGIVIRTKDPALGAPLQQMIEAMRAKSEAIAEAQRKLNALIGGG